MNILTFSSLYPNDINPSHGIFVERRLRKLVAHTDTDATVVAPVPWFPFKARIFGRYADFAATPARAKRYGIDIRYPRYRQLPKIGMLAAPRSMAKATVKTVEEIISTAGPVDVIDAHYFFPDGVAASQLAERFGIPFMVTARGSDVNLIAQFPKPRQMILRAAEKASAVIAVSDALRRTLEKIGVDARKIHVLRNGVDLAFFQPGNRAAVRRKLGMQSPTFISVGVLKEAKGHDVAIESLRFMDDINLVVIGAGEYRPALENRVASLGLEARVRFTGRLDEDSLLEYYQAADALCLASEREGMPNVVLESLACGTPVIATDVGGIGEVVNTPVVGELLRDRQARTLADAWRALTQRGIDRVAIRRVAEGLSWEPTIERLYTLIRQVGSGGP